jgi:hypothetical protein
MNNAQVEYLTSLAGFEVARVDGTVISFKPRPSKCIVVPYDQFKAAMGLEDIRFHWLLGQRNMLAGGSVLAWITDQPNTGDYDLFFTNKTNADDFERFILAFDFKVARESKYALTLFSYESNATLQIVGGGERANYYDSLDRKLFGTPQEVLEGFDIGLCKMAVTADHVYLAPQAIRDLLSKSARAEGDTSQIENRLIKYCVKGYYLPGKMLKYEPAYTDPFSAW